MNKIKYRAWDSKLKCFAYMELGNDNQFHFTTPSVKNGEGEYSSTNLGDWEKCLQLEDVNDSEIYERDIVKRRHATTDGRYYQTIFTEVFIDKEVVVGLDIRIVSDELGQRVEYGTDCEVVGNIHENYDLLK